MPPLMRMCLIMRTTKGFTVIEMVIVMVITSVIILMSGVLLNSSFRSYFTAIEISGLNQQASMAMMRMTKELQQAVSFTVINSTQVTFRTVGGSTISYTWSNPTLTRTGTAARTLSDQVTSLSLTYYQSSFTTTSTLTAVRAITIQMTLNNGREIVPVINTVFLANMK